MSEEEVTPETEPETETEEQTEAEQEPETVTETEAEETPTEQKTEKPKPSQESDSEDEDDEDTEVCRLIGKFTCKVYKCVRRVCRDKYKCEIIKATVMALLAVKLAQECYSIILPLREYIPFQN